MSSTRLAGAFLVDTQLGRVAMLPLMLLLLLAQTGAGEAFNLTIMHTNDVHSRIEETDKRSGACSAAKSKAGECFGGVARIRTMVNQLRSQYPNTLLLDAGDQFQGTLWFYEFGGIVSARFMNLIGYDAMCIGNHEFDKGVAGLVPFAQNLSFPLLSSNIDVSTTPGLKEVVKKSVVLTVAGEKVGIVGYTTTETPYVSSPETVRFFEEVGAVQTEVDKLEQAGITKIIGLGHSGYNMDKHIARHVSGLDIVVGGHTNTFLYNGPPPSIEKPVGSYPLVVMDSPRKEPVLVVQDYAYGKYLGLLHVTFDQEGKVTHWSGNPVLLDNSVPRDAETLAIVQTYLPEVTQLKESVIGQSYVALDADRIICRTEECSLGNLVADAMLEANIRRSSDSVWSDVSLAVVNGGSFRAGLPKGNITVENVIFVQPFRNTVNIVRVSGATILKMFEYCAAQWTLNREDAFGGFLQVAGFKVTYDIRRPVNQRVVEVLITCTECDVPKLEPLVETEEYNLVMSTYLATGGDGYSMFPGEILHTYLVEKLDTDIVMDYIKYHSPLTTGLKGRIQHLKDVENSHLCVGSSNTVLSSAVVVLLSSVIALISLSHS